MLNNLKKDKRTNKQDRRNSRFVLRNFHFQIKVENKWQWKSNHSEQYPIKTIFPNISPNIHQSVSFLNNLDNLSEFSARFSLQLPWYHFWSDYVKNSNLNFELHETPFSLNLNLKKSFVHHWKRTDNSTQNNLFSQTHLPPVLQ